MQLIYCTERFSSCVLPSRASLFPDGLTTLVPLQWQSVSRWWKVLVCGAAYWRWWVLIKLLAGLNQERRGQNTLCHLRLTRTAAPSGEDLPALCTAERKEQMKGTIEETGFLQDFNGKEPNGKDLIFVGKRLLILIIPSFLCISLKA